MKRAVATVAYYVLLESLRSGLLWLAAACALLALGVAGFLSQVAITESGALLTSVAGALLRAAAIFLIATHVVASVAREASDKGVELVLSLPLTRPAWYVGKLAGFACVGALLATAFALPLLAWAAPARLAAWWLSLVAESTLIVSAALFFASATPTAVAATAATLGFYVLARTIPAMQAIAAGPLAGDTPGADAARWAMDTLALFLPRLDTLTRGDWLLYGAPAGAEIAPALGGLAIYLLLLTSAGLFDFSRRNF